MFPTITKAPVCFLTAAALIATSGIATAQTVGPIPFTTAEAEEPAVDEFILALAQGAEVDAALENINRAIAPRRAELVREAVAGLKLISVNPPVEIADVAAVQRALTQTPLVSAADPNRTHRIMAAPDDVHYDKQWYLHPGTAGIDVHDAWESGATGAGVTIAVIDTGSTPHPDLDDKYLPGYDFVSDADVARDGQAVTGAAGNDRDDDPTDAGTWGTQWECGYGPIDSNWHGTHVAGIAAASTRNSYGTAGVAPDARILPIRSIGKCGRGDDMDILEATAWAAGLDVPGVPANPNPADVINLSQGSYGGACPATYQSVIDRALRRGTTIVAAAGNNDENTSAIYPANCAGVIAVGATGPENYRAVYSNYGPVVDIAAPGGNIQPLGGRNRANNYFPERGIYSTANTGTRGPQIPSFSYLQGTSMAAPVVAGVAALMKGANALLSPAEIETLLKQTADPLAAEPDDSVYSYHGRRAHKSLQLGAGKVNASKAVAAARDAGAGSSDEAPTPTPPTAQPQPEPQQPANATTIVLGILTGLMALVAVAVSLFAALPQLRFW